MAAKKSRSKSNSASTFPPAVQADLDELKALVSTQAPATFEKAVMALFTALVGATFTVAKAGQQSGADGGTAGHQGRSLVIECKRYKDTTPLRERELLGEMDQALKRNPHLEAWILAATRELLFQDRDALTQHGNDTGLPVIVVDWSDGLPALAALLARDPATTEMHFGARAGVLAKQLQSPLNTQIDSLKNELQEWQVGFEAVRLRSHERISQIRANPKLSKSAVNQVVAGPFVLRRAAVSQVMTHWWRTPKGTASPLCVVGEEGVGKTWAAFDWLAQVEAELPITLVVASSGWPDVSKITETGVLQVLGESLQEVTEVRDAAYWRERARRMLRRPAAEGPAMVLLIDGLNQEPQVDWPTVMHVLQGPRFDEHVRTIVTTRQIHFDIKLHAFKTLIEDPPHRADVKDYDATELGAMLAQEGLSQEDLSEELLGFSKTPRIFALVMKLRASLKDTRHLTVHLLLLEYGRSTFPQKALSDKEWQDWMRGVAKRARAGMTAYSEKELAETTDDAASERKLVYRRLSEIIEGPFVQEAVEGKYQLDPALVAHALAASLVERLTNEPGSRLEDILGEWLEPIAGFDERAEVLRAAVAISLATHSSESALSVLVTAWLQTQNLRPSHQSDLNALAVLMPSALLDTVERSSTQSQSAAQRTALGALRALDRSDAQLRTLLVERAAFWLSRVSLDLNIYAQQVPAEDQRSLERLEKRIGPTATGRKTVLGVSLEILERDVLRWGDHVPALLEGFALEHAVPAFVAGALSSLLTPMQPHWEALRWMCLLNEIDPEQAAQALREASAQIQARVPEPGVNPLLAGRLAAYLLYLTGFDVDETAGMAIDTRIDANWTYADDYLKDPARSYLKLERRHADLTLADTGIDVVRRAHRLDEIWLDPTFKPSQTFCSELSDVAATLSVSELYTQRQHTPEVNAFERLWIPLARCAPGTLATLWRRWASEANDATPATRLWRAWSFNDALLIYGPAEQAAARHLRKLGAESSKKEEQLASNELVLAELPGVDAFEQAVCIIETTTSPTTTTVTDLLDPLNTDDVDRLVARYTASDARTHRQLLVVLATYPPKLSEKAWTWIASFLSAEDWIDQRLALMVLLEVDERRLGRQLFDADWTWNVDMDSSTAHLSSLALRAAMIGQPFDRVLPRLAPWHWLAAARERGADASEVAEAVQAFNELILADDGPAFDAGAELILKRRMPGEGSHWISIRPLPVEGDDSIAAFERMQDAEAVQAAIDEARETFWKRIKAARKAGSSLILNDMDPADFEMVARLEPQAIAQWIEGFEDMTKAFVRRVHLAEVPFMSLCEVLLKSDPSKGVRLWHALRAVVRTKVIGGARVSEFLHMAFRAPDSPEVEALRLELLALGPQTNDQGLYEVSLAASWNGREDWLQSIIRTDKASSLAWRQRRARVLTGMQSNSELAVPGAWPEGGLRGTIELLEVQAARRQWLDACARHWWREYWRREEADASYAAWILFRACADRRAELWVDAETEAADTSSQLYQRKRWHARANRELFNANLDKSSANLKSTFLDRRLDGDVAPWRQ